MGNGFFPKNCKINGCCCSNNHLVKNLTKTEVVTRDISPQESMKERKTSSKNDKMHNIINYFNKEEKEILADLYKNQNKEKKTTKNTKKKDNTKYEEMLKRILEQQNIKIVGPKRRKTIRKDDNNIKEMVKQILAENKNEVIKVKKNKENEDATLFAIPQIKKGGLSQIINMDKKILTNKINYISYISNK